MSAPVHWTQIAPDVAARLPEDVLHDEVVLPVTSAGVYCPWPWEPQQWVGVPLGMYHCRYCGDMVVAGVQHTDWGWEGTIGMALALSGVERIGPRHEEELLAFVLGIEEAGKGGDGT